MGWIKGVEPLTSRATIWRSNQLSYIHHMARLKRFELLTYCLEGSCSIQLSYRRKQVLERVMGIEPTQSAWKADILPLNYTRKYHLNRCTVVQIQPTCILYQLPILLSTPFLHTFEKSV
jgi:hypothetical protein